MTERSYRWLFWGLAIVGLLADQASKYLVFHLLYETNQQSERSQKVVTEAIIPDLFGLRVTYDNSSEGKKQPSWRSGLQGIGSEELPYVNKGALFGWFQDAGWGNAAFAVVSILAAAGIIFWSTRPSLARDWLHCAALGLILAGTLGNFYDRIVFDGVRDFLDFYITRWQWHWPTFNIADVCLVSGASLLLLQAFFGKAVEPAERAAAESAEMPVAAEAKSA
jgi:lipoprotein signal peptidase